MDMGRLIRRRSIARLGTPFMTAALAASLLGSPAVAAAPDGPPTKVIVMFREAPGSAEQRLIREAGGTIDHVYTLIDGIAGEVPANAIAGLRRNPRVRSVNEDLTVSAVEPVVEAATTTDIEYDNAWGVTHIGSRAVHEAGFWGQGVKVAVIDSGIDYIHEDPSATNPPVDPEFLGNYKGGVNYIANGRAVDDPMDDNGHGTHVAGILAAEKNGYLVVGVAPQVDLYALKILDAAGNGYESDLVAALQWSVGHGFDVVNMSLGTHTDDPALKLAVANAAAAGLLMVAASGNTVTFEEIFGYGCPVAYPAAYDKVMATTFTNQNDALTGYSCTGSQVDFASPGDEIFSTVPVGTCANCSRLGYAALSGTSMASPHLAGAVALLLSAGIADANDPGLFDDVRARLCATANTGYGVQSIFGSTPIPKSDARYAKYFGCGVLDVGEAVTGLTPVVNQPPVANNDVASTTQDTAKTIAVLANDTDPDGPVSGLSVDSTTAPSHGSVAINGDGTVTYTPAAGYTGADTFQYRAKDSSGGVSNLATVSVTVSATGGAAVMHIWDIDGASSAS